MNISHWLKKLTALDWSYAMQVYALGLIIGAGLVVGIGLQVAQAWTAPGANPPAGNIGAPITASSVAQRKDGNLTIGGTLTSVGSLAVGGNILLEGLFQMDYSDTYDVYIRGKDGAALKRALTGNKSNGTLYLNQTGEYTSGTIVGGSKLTASKICLPNSTESNCRTSWPSPDVNVSSYNNLPTGAIAGYCIVNTPGNDGLGAVLPAVGAPGSGCSCVNGWTAKKTGKEQSEYWTCIKN